MESSDDLINEQAWLIARGVRPLALLDSVDKNSVAMQCAFQHLIEKTIDPTIPADGHHHASYVRQAIDV